MKNTTPMITMNNLLKSMFTPRYIIKKVLLIVLALLSYWPNVISQERNMVEIVYVYYSILFLVFVFSLADDLNILIRATSCLIEEFRSSPE